MPLLDVSEVLVDPDFATEVEVITRTSGEDDHGRVKTASMTIPGVTGVITSAGPNDLQRLPEDQRTGRVMSFICQRRLNVTAKGRLPDLVRWKGDLYVVRWVDPYVEYGNGFVQTIISSMNHQDVPLE